MCVLSRALTDRRVGSFELAFQYPVSDAISPTRFKQECMTVFAHGGASFAIAMAGSVYTDGTLEKHSFELLKPVYREIAEKEGLLLGSVSVPYAGVVFSDATRLFYGREDNHARYGASIEGATRVLLDLHLPFDVIMDWNLTPDYLKDFELLVLPNTAALSKEQGEVLRSYVPEGGRILATFETKIGRASCRERV